MKVGIICAGDRELAPFLKHMGVCNITEKAMMKFYECTINEVSVVACFCGICKVNAAIATGILLDHFHAACIINSGTCGAMANELAVFDTVISTEVAYHDLSEEILTESYPWMDSVYFSADAKLLDLSKKAVSDYNASHKIVFGRMVTGEAFIDDEGRDRINKSFAPLSVDMETGSIAHVCYVNKVPFIAIRTVTDTPTYNGAEHFELNCEKASETAKNITLGLLNQIRFSLMR